MNLYYYINHKHDLGEPATYELRQVHVVEHEDGAQHYEVIILESRFRNELERVQKYLESDVRFGSDEHLLTYENEEWFQYAKSQGWDYND